MSLQLDGELFSIVAGNQNALADVQSVAIDVRTKYGIDGLASPQVPENDSLVPPRRHQHALILHKLDREDPIGVSGDDPVTVVKHHHPRLGLRVVDTNDRVGPTNGQLGPLLIVVDHIDLGILRQVLVNVHHFLPAIDVEALDLTGRVAEGDHIFCPAFLVKPPFAAGEGGGGGLQRK